jgi:hypothetical protein
MAKKRKKRRPNTRVRKKGPVRVTCKSCGARVRATVVRSGRLCCMDCMKLTSYMFDSACEALERTEKELAEPNPMQ